MAATPPAQGSSAVPDLLGVLRQRKEQAEALKASYAPPPMARDTMRYWLAQAAKQHRLAAGRLLSHIAAEASMDQSSIYRFEEWQAWPRDVELILTAYAQDLEIDVIDLWDAALRMWRESGETATVAQLAERKGARSKDRAAEELDEDFARADQRNADKASAAGRTRRGTKRSAPAS